MATSQTRPAVVSFYEQQPFNIHGSAVDAADVIRGKNQIELNYPDLHAHLSRNKGSFLDVGCGGGWAANTVGYYYECASHGFDITTASIAFAREVAGFLAVSSKFWVGNLFEEAKGEGAFDVVASLGVLHHTDDTFAALKSLAAMVSRRPTSRLYVGLYHRHGREPFVEHFDELRSRGASESELFAEYARLSPRGIDDALLRSWFRDQVLHPHETLHTLEEILPMLLELDFQLESTSINRFGRCDDVPRILALEPSYRASSHAALREGRFFPGFFTFCAKRRT